MNTTRRAYITAWSSVICGRGVPRRLQYTKSKHMPNRSSDKAAAVIRENNLDHGGDIAIGVKAAMKRLGLHDLEKQIEFDFEMIRALIKKGWSVQSVVERCYLPFGIPSAPEIWFIGRSANLKTLSVQENCAKYLYLLGHGLWHSDSPGKAHEKIDRMVARFALDISVTLGDQRAHLDLVQLSMLENSSPPRASLHAVEKAAHSKKDWRATSLYARYLLQFKRDKQSLELAHNLAHQLDQMVAPSNSGTAGQLTSTPKLVFDAPWMLLRDVNERLYNDTSKSAKSIQDKHENAYYDAVMTGVKHWNDPIACQNVANHPLTPEHSEIWVELMSKRAMQGDADATWELARYYVQTEGWYPGKGARPTGHEAEVAIEWMRIAVASSIDDMNKMPGRCVVLALILRESGLPEAGLQEIKDCLRAIKEVKHGGTGKGISTAIRQLEEFVEKWNEPDFGTIRTAAKFFDRQG